MDDIDTLFFDIGLGLYFLGVILSYIVIPCVIIVCILFFTKVAIFLLVLFIIGYIIGHIIRLNTR